MDYKYTYSHLGYNLKITDMQAACALAQMDRLDGFIAKRRANFAYLKGRLRALCRIFASAAGNAELRSRHGSAFRWSFARTPASSAPI